MDERAEIERIERADVEDFARLLLRPSVEQERLYRAYFGDARYDRLHGLALRQSLSRAPLTKSANVVVLPGIMGSSLDVTGRDGSTRTVWLNALRILSGGMITLALDADGQTDADPALQVSPSGILKKFYGEQLLSLSERANVRVFWYDWRKSLDLAASELALKLRSWFAPDAKVFLVAHSMGGLVCRTFYANAPDQWKQHIANLIMLGTPNFGAPAITQVLTGLEETVQWLSVADLFHTAGQMQSIINSFPGIYAMLPSPAILPHLALLYRAETYAPLSLSQRHLDAALQHHERLNEAWDAERMIYIAGYNQPTLSDIPDLETGAWRTDHAAYSATRNGDNRVPHSFGFPLQNGKPTLPVYYVEESHGRLPAHPAVLDALDGLIRTGVTTSLLRELPARRGKEDKLTGLDVLRETVPNRAEVEALIGVGRQALGVIREHGNAPPAPQVWGENTPNANRSTLTKGANNPASPQVWGVGGATTSDENGSPQTWGVRGAEPDPTPYSSSEGKLEDYLLGGFLGEHPQGAASAPLVPKPEPRRIALEIGVVQAEIDEVHRAAANSALPIDCLAVGHYLGVKPQTAELALDRAISDDVRGGVPIEREDFLVNQLSERGIIRGDLAQPFLLPDPRTRNQPETTPRLIAFVGMGVPGRFGTPELIVAAREVCWTLGRIGKKHLATVVIGSGKDNIPIPDAIAAWLEGAKQALAAAQSQGAGQNRNALTRLTFAERNPQRVRDIDAAIQAEITRLANLPDADPIFTLTYAPLSDEEKLALQLRELDEERRSLRHPSDDESLPEILSQPTRITVSLDTRGYRFGAITGSASIPERDIAVDAKLIMDANTELAAEADPIQQKEKGVFLERLLIPDDFQAQLQSPAPVVLMLDATTARIHWEMMAQTQPLTGAAWNATAEADGFVAGDFLGTSRGLTRQLRTAFAPPPEPPPPPTRRLRVLIVADPAEDAHLPGAEEEGLALEELFQQFNARFTESTGNHIEIVRLSGPFQAKRTTVLRHLMLHTYDILHFAGHCVYDAVEPSRSGWIFTGGERLTANELRRIDRVPRFVFSNACESGVTPERADLRSEALAPSFAESFFARGVSNFVCTAWAVDDLASREFAVRLYAELLSLKEEERRGQGTGNREQDKAEWETDSSFIIHHSSFSPAFMFAAMRDARRALLALPTGTRSWGAYQHYGNPYLRLFSPRSLEVTNKSRGQKTKTDKN